jgi:hypothetical protein
VRRLKDGLPLRKYERNRFYGPFPDRERGYTDYKPWKEGEEKEEGEQIQVVISPRVSIPSS